MNIEKPKKKASNILFLQFFKETMLKINSYQDKKLSDILTKVGLYHFIDDKS